MMMVLESQISVHFTEFSTIFNKITSNEYSDEQKHEMMEFFKTQTKERHLEMINTLALGTVLAVGWVRPRRVSPRWLRAPMVACRGLCGEMSPPPLPPGDC